MNDQEKTFVLFDEAEDFPVSQDKSERQIHIEPPTGQKLAQARARLGLSVEDVARALILSEEIIEAIEDGNYAVLPGVAYATGYVRAYAERVNLDADYLVQSDPDLGLRAIDKDVDTRPERASTRTIETHVFPSSFKWAATAIKGVAYILLISILLLGWNFWDNITEWWTDRIKTEKIIELENESAPTSNINLRNSDRSA